MAATRLTSEDADRLRSFERRVHDAVSSGYYGFFTPVTLHASEPLLDAVGLAPGMRILDVASGPGSVAAAACGAGPGRSESISPAHGRVGAPAQSRDRVPRGRCRASAVPDQSFDAVVCSFGLGHFPYPEVAVAECLRVAKAGGRLAFSWWDQPSRQRVQGLFRDAVAEVGAAPTPDLPATHSSLRFCDPTAFTALLREGGLIDVTLEGHAAAHRFNSTDAMWQGGLDGMGLTGASLRSQDASTLEAIRAAFERLALAYKDGDGLNVPVAFRIGAGRRPA